MLFQAFFRARFQLIQIPSGLGDADDRDVESFVANQVLQRREDLFVGEIARGSEKYKRIRHSFRHLLVASHRVVLLRICYRLLCRRNYMLDRKAKVLHHDLHRRRHAEGMHAQHHAGAAGITFPADL